MPRTPLNLHQKVRELAEHRLAKTHPMLGLIDGTYQEETQRIARDESFE